MKFGVIHYNTPGYNTPGETLAEFLDWAAATGFQYVELTCEDLGSEGSQNPHAEAEKVRGMLEQRGLKTSAVAAHNDFVVLEADEVAQQMKRLKLVCELAQIAGTDVLRTEGGAPKPEVPEERWAEAWKSSSRSTRRWSVAIWTL